jgi:hypothetical protein
MKTSINNLILLAIYVIEGPATFEKIVAQCFNDFPEHFSLENFPQWPDSHQLDRPLRRLVSEKMVKKTGKNFTLTKEGKKIAQRVNTVLHQPKLIL